MSKVCAKCEKPVYPTEELKCLDKVSQLRFSFGVSLFGIHDDDNANVLGLFCQMDDKLPLKGAWFCSLDPFL